MRNIPYFSAILAGLLATAAPLTLLAQEKAISLEVRGSVQDDYLRIVLSGPELPQPKVDESQAGILSLDFNRAVALSGEAALSSLDPAPQVKADGDTVTLTVPGLTRQRTLKIGNRLLIDLFTGAQPGPAAQTKSPSPTPSLPAEKPAARESESTSLVREDTRAKAPPEKPVAGPTVADAAGAKEKPAIPAPVLTPALVENAAAPRPAVPSRTFEGSAVVTIGSTEGLSLAAFERLGYLWIVTSRENMGVPPVVSGPSAASLGAVEAIKIEGGSAYRLKMPQGAYIVPEGGGLVWRLIVTPQDPKLKSVTIDRDFGNNAAGPQMHIPLIGATGVLRVPDPVAGDDLAVVLVNRAGARLRNSETYVDFDMIPAFVGAVVRPRADGLSIAVLPQQVDVTRQGGLRMSAAGPSSGMVQTAGAEGADPVRTPQKTYIPTRIYDFKNWALGGASSYMPMRRSVDLRVATAAEDKKLPEIIVGAKFMMAQGLPQEATGFVTMALGYMPLLRESVEFQSIRAAILAMGQQPDEALAIYQTIGLADNDELALWKAYVLAQDGKLDDAQKILPRPAIVPLLNSYSPRVRTLILPDLIEAVLSRGDVNLAESMIDMFAESGEGLTQDHAQAVSYYRGRAATLRGNYDAANDFFREASDGLLGPYPVRATLMLVQRGLSSKTIARADAVRKLERFRFGWRGDSLESQVLENLGMIYVTGGEQRRGLTILRDAAAMARTPAERDNLVAVMQKAFRELFSGKTKERMSAMESAAVAAEFAELMPSGGEGEQITLTIADQMVAVDLLDRAADMIEPMVERTEKLSDAMRYAEKAAGIRIIDRRPEEALRIIDKALSRPDAQAQKTLPASDVRAIALLRARAKADMKRTDDAFAELSTIPEAEDSLRLMADTAWRAQRWPEAAEAFGKLVKLAGLDATRPPTREQAQMVLNQALALNLSGNEKALATLSIAYGDIMRRTELYRPFQLVTRTAREAQLADRETLLKLVSEVDLFKDVLESYKKGGTPSAKPAATPKTATPKAAAPAAAKPAADAAREAAAKAATSDTKPAVEAQH